MSMSSSSSPAPSSIPDIRIPDDSIIVHFTSVDPTQVFDNPIHSGTGAFECDCKVNTEVSDKLIQVLQQYRNLVSVNFDISINNVKHQLKSGELKSRHIYDLLDKFFMDVPDIIALDASWLTKESVEHLIQKQHIHEDIKSTLYDLNTSMATGTAEAPSQCNQDGLEQPTKPNPCSVISDEFDSDPEITDPLPPSVDKSSPSVDKNKNKVQKKKKTKRGKKPLE